MYCRNPQNHRTRFKSPTLPEDTPLSKKSIGVKFPVDLDAYLRSLPDISGFVRSAVVEKLERDALLPTVTGLVTVASDAIAPTQEPQPEPIPKTRGRKKTSLLIS